MLSSILFSIELAANMIAPLLILGSVVIVPAGIIGGIFLIIKARKNPQAHKQYQGWLLIVLSLLFPFLITTLWGLIGFIADRASGI